MAKKQMMGASPYGAAATKGTPQSTTRTWTRAGATPLAARPTLARPAFGETPPKQPPGSQAAASSSQVRVCVCVDDHRPCEGFDG